MDTKSKTQAPSVAAAIVPAYNEEKTIGHVVSTLVESGAFREVIVVSDGSTDGTAAVARAAGATLVHELSHNSGKGAAMSHGVMHTDAPIIAFFDADLIGFKEEHVHMLLKPVLEDGLYMHVGLRDRNRITNFLEKLMPWISGERAMRREMFDAIPTKYITGFKVEAAIDFFCEANGLPIDARILPGLSIVTKVRKVGLPRALVQYTKMWTHVGLAMIEVRMARKQFVERGTHMSHSHQ